MRFFVALLLALLVPFVAIAADRGSGQVVIGSNDILRGRFVEERHLKGFNGPMKSEGHFVVAPQYGLIWELKKPFPTTTIITPAGLVQNINGVTVMNLTSQKIPFMLHLYDTLGGALTGKWDALETDFIVTGDGDPQNWQVTLVPRQTDNPAMPFTSLNISGHHFVENVVMLKADGNSDTLTFFDESVSSASPTVSEKQAFNSGHP